MRHLLSIRLTEISSTATPAYPQTNTALRHLAAQFGEDPDDILALAEKGELRSLFVRTDLTPIPPAPAPAPNETRKEETMDPKVAAAQLGKHT